MKYRLQDKLQSQVAAVLPGYQVKCEFSSHNVIDVSLIEPATREAMTRVLVDNLLAVERGEQPPNAV